MKQAAKVNVALLLAATVGGLSLLAAATFLLRGRQAQAVTLFVSGDTRGYLEPCGCRRDQAGGLPGRLTLVKQNTAGDRLLLDVGNLTTGDRAYEMMKLGYLLDGMREMRYDAVNLGRREAALDRATLEKLTAEGKVPFVSCNVLNRDTRQPIAEPYRIASAGGLRIGITGVAALPDDEVGPGLLVRPATEALADALPALKQRCDWLVVLAFAPQETIRALADRFHEVDCILGGDVPQSSEAAETINRAVAFNVVEKGKVLGVLSFRRNGRQLELAGSKALKVADTIARAPEMDAIIHQFKEKLRAQNVELASTEGLDPIQRSQTTADLYVGQAACASCHAEAHKINVASAHTRAYDTLVQKGSQFDPDCLRCHTVGYGARDGFFNPQKTPALAGVQCENCHGRGGEHIKAMQAHIKQASTFRPVTPNTCVKCHDKENSENFDYATYWPKIAHGRR